MKNLITILIVLLIGSQQTFAQGAKKLQTFKETVLPEYNTYFNQAELTANGQLSLSAQEKYSALSVDGKKAIMSNITKAWRESLVQVHYGSQSELWGWNAKTENTQLLDKWDLNAPQTANITTTFSRPHPWFFYVGGQLGGDSEGDINLSVNGRIGFFLLLNRWDMAATISAGLTGNSKYGAATGWQNLGLMTRVHFPLKKYRISPNIGGEITYALYDKPPAKVTESLVIGLRWFVGFGSLDIGIKIGNVTTGSGGVTMVPKGKSGK